MDIENANLAAAKILEGARKEADMTQQDIADVTGLSLTTIQRGLSGSRSMKVGVFLAIAEAVGGDVPDLVRRAIIRAEKMSQADGTNISKHPTAMSVAELESYRRDQAANKRHAESDADEDD